MENTSKRKCRRTTLTVHCKCSGYGYFVILLQQRLRQEPLRRLSRVRESDKKCCGKRDFREKRKGFTFFTKIPLPTLFFIAFPNPACFFFKIHTLRILISVKRPMNDMNVRSRLALSINILSLRVF